MSGVVVILYLPDAETDAPITYEVRGTMPTMDLINGLNALMVGLCLDVVGPEKKDGPELAERMKNHMLHGRYEVLRSYVVATEQPKNNPIKDE